MMKQIIAIFVGISMMIPIVYAQPEELKGMTVSNLR